MLFDVRTLRRDGWCVVSVVGEVDLATMPALRQELERVPSEEVALDLRGVDHVDPVALGVVLAASVRAKRRGGRFAVVCADGRPRDLLAESGIDTIVEVYADPDELTRADT